jgi:hypothetical protein
MGSVDIVGSDVEAKLAKQFTDRRVIQSTQEHLVDDLLEIDRRSRRPSHMTAQSSSLCHEHYSPNGPGEFGP